MTRTAVLGAGALGLTVAYRLAQRGDDVVLIEREPLPGGLAAGFEIEPGMWLDKFYHHLFRGDRHAIGLIEELGLGGDLLWPRPLTVTLRDGQIHQLDSPTSLLRFEPLPLFDRLRMGAWLAYLKALPSPDRLEGRTRVRLDPPPGWAAPATTSSGARCCVASSASWPTRSPCHGSGRASMTARPSSATCAVASSASTTGWRSGLTELGGDLRFGTEVREVRTDAAAGGLTVTPAEGPQSGWTAWSATLAVRLTCRLAPELPDDYRSHHEWQGYGAHCLVLALDRPLTESYWMNINDPGFPFMALVEHTNYVDPPITAGGGSSTWATTGRWTTRSCACPRTRWLPNSRRTWRASTRSSIAAGSPAPGHSRHRSRSRSSRSNT